MIKDRNEALNCISACAYYLQRVNDSPRAATDLREAVNMLARPHMVISADGGRVFNIVEILVAPKGTIIKVA